MNQSKKTQAHIRYKNSAGLIVPGVTTILGILNKPALIIWANRLGLQGIDSTKYRDEAADIGTLAHHLVISHLQKAEPDTSDYSAIQIDQANNAFQNYLAWERGHIVKPLMVETPFVSEEKGFGGTIDFYGLVDDITTIIDFKTGSGFYPEHLYQVAAYGVLLKEAGHSIGQAILLRIGRTADEGFEEKAVYNLDRETHIFLHCLAIYKLQHDKPK